MHRIGFRRIDPARRALAAAGAAHFLHDGYTDLLYVLLPIWQKEYALSYAAIAGLRALYYGTMAAAQVPGTRWLGRFGPSGLLFAGTLVAALGFLIAGVTTSLAGLCIGLTVGGLGSSTQHPNASALVTDAYAEAARGPLGLYNFTGDLGKAVFPAATALALIVLPWRPTSLLLALVGLGAAIGIRAMTPRSPITAGVAATRDEAGDTIPRGFAILFVLGMLDTACRMGYLLFLPFLLQARGAGGGTIGLALALVFAGGAFGKATCGWLGERLGLMRTVTATELATTALILATLLLPLNGTLVLLPFLGIALNGTSSVLYGTVPEFAPSGRTAHVFALFYTGVIGAGALAPIGYGALGDVAGRTVGVEAASATALLTIPFAGLLVRALAATSGADIRHA